MTAPRQVRLPYADLTDLDLCTAAREVIERYHSLKAIAAVGTSEIGDMLALLLELQVRTVAPLASGRG